MTEKPEFVTEEHLEFLDRLRESGITNMFGGVSWLVNHVWKNEDLDRPKARKVLSYWMDTFDERHPK